MKPFIIISIVFVVLLVLFILYCIVMYYSSLKERNKLFTHRFESDKRISFYTKEQFGLSFEALEVPMEDVILRGGIYSYPNAKEDAIFVYAHGMYSGVCAYLQDIEFFCRKGYKVVALNHEGTDESSGKSIRGLVNSLRCLDYTIKYIKNSAELKGKDIYVAGHSWGGFATVNIVNYHKDIKGIIAFSPFIDIKGCLATSSPKGYKLITPFIKMIEKKCCGKYAKASGLHSLKDYNGKVVILHSKDDMFVNFEHNTKRLMDKYPNFTYMIYDGKNHNPHYTNEALAYMGKYYSEIKLCRTKEEETAYMQATDFNKMGELDYKIMDEAFTAVMK